MKARSQGLAAVHRFGIRGALLFIALAAPAAVRTWNGGGGDNYWMTAANWSGAVGPAAGDDLLFPSGAARLSSSNNFPSGTVFNSITLSGGGYTVRGETIALSSGITNLNGANVIYTPFLLASNQTVAADDYLELQGGLELNGNTLTLAGTAELACNAPITGAGSVVKTGPGSAGFYGNSSYLGTTEVTQGTLIVGHSNALGLATAGTSVAAGAVIGLSGSIAVAEPLVLGGTLLASASGTCTWSGPITLTNHAAIQTANPLTLSGPVSGTGSLAHTTTGTLRLTGNNTYTGPTTNSGGGTLIIDGAQPASDVYCTGTLGGTGTVGSVFALEAGLFLNAGDPAPGRLTTSNLTLNGGTFLAVQLNSTTPASGYTQLRVLGRVTLTGLPVLGGSLGFLPALSNSLTIIDNGGADPVSGIFRGLPEGTVFGLNGAAFKITYVGGTGNDVVLTRVTAPPVSFSATTALTNGQIQLQATGALDGVYYDVQAASGLVPAGAWSNIGTVLPVGGVLTFTDTDAPLYPMRFYRVLSP